MAPQQVTHLPSIQGTQQQVDARGQVASPDDVDLYVDGASDEIVECRERGRHPFPTIRSTGLTFNDMEGELFVRHVVCPCCGCAVRRELWEWVGRGKYGRMVFVSASVSYRKNTRGETYPVPPGRGRVTSRAVKDSLATRAMQGQSVAALRKALRRQATD